MIHIYKGIIGFKSIFPSQWIHQLNCRVKKGFRTEMIASAGILMGEVI